MDKLIELVIQLESEVKRKEREIDNPALVMSVLSELEFFYHALEDQKFEEMNNEK